MRHQRPSWAKRGAVSFHAAGSSTGGRSYFTGTAQAATTRMLLSAMRRMVGCLNAPVDDDARLLGFALDVLRGAFLGEVPVGHQLEEHRHEEDGEEGRGEHAAHHARAGGVARAG